MVNNDLKTYCPPEVKVCDFSLEDLICLSATSDEDETGDAFIFTHRYVNEHKEDYYWGAPIHALTTEKAKAKMM